jgi:cytochrome c553
MKKMFAVIALMSAMQFAAAADVVGNAKTAENKVAMCIGCHAIPGYKAVFPEVYQVPMIGGQSAAYIESALKAYRKGDRKHPSMRGIAGSLSDQDIADLAAYYSQQK